MMSMRVGLLAKMKGGVMIRMGFMVKERVRIRVRVIVGVRVKVTVKAPAKMSDGVRCM